MSDHDSPSIFSVLISTAAIGLVVVRCGGDVVDIGGDIARSAFRVVRVANQATSVVDVSRPGIRTVPGIISDGREIPGEVVRVVSEGEEITTAGIASARVGRRIDAATSVQVFQPRLLAAYPQTEEEFIRVYGRSPSALEEGQIHSLNSLFSSDQQVLRVDASSTIEGLLDAYADSAPFVILGHSDENGRVLILPDGTHIPTDELHARCAERGMHCIILTCYGEDLGITGEITPEDAYSLWSFAANASWEDQLSVAEFASYMRSARHHVKTRRRIMISGIAVGGVRGAFIYYSEEPS